MCLYVETKKKTEGDCRRHRRLGGCTYSYLTKERQTMTKKDEEKKYVVDKRSI